MFKGVMFCEGHLVAGVVEYPAEATFNAFRDGFSCGAGHYGGDGAMIYTRDDLEELDPNDAYEAKVIAAINEHLPEVNP